MNYTDRLPAELLAWIPVHLHTYNPDRWRAVDEDPEDGRVRIYARNRYRMALNSAIARAITMVAEEARERQAAA